MNKIATIVPPIISLLMQESPKTARAVSSLILLDQEGLNYIERMGFPRKRTEPLLERLASNKDDAHFKWMTNDPNLLNGIIHYWQMSGVVRLKQENDQEADRRRKE